MHPTDCAVLKEIFFERFDWIDTLPTEAEKQTVEDILVEYNDIFARHGLDIGTQNFRSISHRKLSSAKAYHWQST